MKFFYLLILTCFVCGSMQSQIINIPDPNFKNALLNHTSPIIDTNGDGEITVSEAAPVTTLFLSGQQINSLEGIENFTSISVLNCVDNNLTELNLDFLTSITSINFLVNPNLVSVDLSNLTSIQNSFTVQHLDNLEEMDLGSLSQVGGSFAVNNLLNLSFLDISSISELGMDLFLFELPMVSNVNLANLTMVGGTLDIRFLPMINSLDLSKLETVVGELFLSFNSGLTSINFDQLTNVNNILILDNGSNGLSFPSLTNVNTNIAIRGGVGMDFLDIPILETLERLYIYENPDLVSISIPNLINLEGALPSLGQIYNNPQLTSIDLGNLDFVDGDLILENLPALTSLNLGNLEIVDNDLTVSTGAYSNATFASLVTVGNVFKFECNLPSSLSVPNLVATEVLDARDGEMTSIDLTSLETIESLRLGDNSLTEITFPSLQSALLIDLGYNSLNDISFADPNVNVQDLWLYDNELDVINISNVQGLKTLNVTDNSLAELDVSPFTLLEELLCINNQLTELDLSANINLQELDCSHNAIASLTIEANGDLQILKCEFNDMTELILNNELVNFFGVECNNNLLAELDVSTIQATQFFVTAFSNELLYLNLKNGIENTTILDLNDNAGLEFICVDNFSSEIDYVETVLSDLGYVDCVFNSYCSFLPGGTYFDVTGSVKFDFDNNGCDPTDIDASFFEFDITNGTDSGTIITNQSGDYFIPVQMGTHMITPIFENPDYWNMNPSSLTVDFPTDPSPFIQDFCITANGVHPDLEIEIIPVTAARPGFDATYRIFYKNKGNQLQSGEVLFSYNDELMDYISSYPVFDDQGTNLYSWNYIDLQPFESRTIDIVFNINTPTDTPPVNIDDVLEFFVTINPTANDETPEDNEIVFRQLVVGSFDPNDKRCLQGDFIEPDRVGEFVHYVIRFENTGTFPAENVVVKDIIDTSKFEIESLRPLNSSNDFVTRVNDNVVEYIFEGINLPFQEGQNQGYLLFKIKTSPDLELGDVFTNKAEIYFDFNFPIETNTVETTVAELLGVEDFDVDSKFILYPNPTNTMLHIQNIENQRITYLEIFGMLGQLVMAFPSDTATLDISQLQGGSYFLKVYTEKGSSYARFIKK